MMEFDANMISTSAKVTRVRIMRNAIILLTRIPANVQRFMLVLIVISIISAWIINASILYYYYYIYTYIFIYLYIIYIYIYNFHIYTK